MGIFPLMLLALFALAACETAPSTDRLTRFFDEIAFGNPASYEGQSAAVAKWTKPIHPGLSGADADKHRDQVEKQLTRFSRITGVAVTADGPANLTVVFVADADIPITRLGVVKDFVPCAARLGSSHDGIDRAEIVINVANENTIKRCLAHELAHAFGFRHHSGLLPSVLSPVHAATELTAWDELALGVLYDPAVRHGASRADTLAVARERLARLRTGTQSSP